MANSQAGVIIVAAGTSSRMGGTDKIFAPILGKPLIYHTITTFEQSPLVREIILVLAEHNIAAGKIMARQEHWGKLSHICLGGDSRQDSVKAGMNYLSSCKWVLVHDGARPCVTNEMISEGLKAVVQTGIAIPALPITDTVKEVDNELVIRTLERNMIKAIQTPQVFSTEILRLSHEPMGFEGTDDASMLEGMGYQIRTFPGARENIKVTTHTDLKLVEYFLTSRKEPPIICRAESRKCQ